MNEAGDDREIPEHRRQRGHREVLVAVEDADDHARHAEEDDDREEDPRQRHREAVVLGRQAEGRHDQRREQHAERCHGGQAEEQQPEDRRCDTPGACLLALLEQLGEDRHERGCQRRVCDERADEVRDLERDRERVDLALDAEVAARDDLAHEAGEPRQAGGDAEDGCGRRQAAPGGRFELGGGLRFGRPVAHRPTTFTGRSRGSA